MKFDAGRDRIARRRGTTVQIGAMRAAHLTPPRFEDKRSSFWVTFRNHTLLGPEAVSWLNKFGGYRLTDDQRIAMVFARQSGMMTNRDYRALCNVDIAMATRELRSLCAQGIFAQFGTGRWTTYSLASQFIDKPVAQPAFSEAGDAVMRYVLQHGNITNREVQELLSVNRDQASRLLGRLRTAGVLVSHGTGRWTIYSRPA